MLLGIKKPRYAAGRYGIARLRHQQGGGAPYPSVAPPLFNGDVKWGIVYLTSTPRYGRDHSPINR
jgi:hypothetical protein